MTVHKNHGMPRKAKPTEGMSDDVRAVGLIRVCLDNLKAVETSGDEVADRHIMEAEQSLRRALSVLNNAVR